jgi:hypothetical protein
MGPAFAGIRALEPRTAHTCFGRCASVCSLGRKVRRSDNEHAYSLKLGSHSSMPLS